MWPVYDGPEAWAASCHFSSTIKQCLEPLTESELKTLTIEGNTFIVPALYFITLCEHQSVLTDPQTNNAECIHQRMLSDDILKCQGLLNWYAGNVCVVMNINYPDQVDKWLSNLRSSVLNVYITMVIGDIPVAVMWKS